MKCQFGISSLKEDEYGGRRTLPYVFTETGIAMLSTVLKTERAIKISIRIINTFIEIRKFLLSNINLYKEVTEIRYILIEHDEKINEIFNKFDTKCEFKQKIFFEGQIFDSYSLIIDIIKKSNKEIIIIDNYIDKSLLDILSNKNKDISVTIVTKNNLLNVLDVTKFNKQYPRLNIKISNKFHDRFIIIDNKYLYHLGASIKDLGNKCFSINRISDN